MKHACAYFVIVSIVFNDNTYANFRIPTTSSCTVYKYSNTFILFCIYITNQYFYFVCDNVNYNGTPASTARKKRKI